MLKKIDNDFYVAIYIRLSKEDNVLGESESVNNQKKLLLNYVKSLNYNVYDIYIDDGFTGTNFNRPAFQKMLKDITDGFVNMVVTKDLSRLSRDYIGTGEYIENWFPKHNIRYVALTDNIDTFTDNGNNDIAPFKAILNDMYAKDLSKKIRTAMRTMQISGKWVGGCTPYGYVSDPNDKNKLAVHTSEGVIITRIFNSVKNGKKINEIKDELNKENVPTFKVSRNRALKQNDSGKWSSEVLKKILTSRVYTGDLVQNKKSRVSYKCRKVVNNTLDKWIIVENTHEALIDKTTFNLVQGLLKKNNQRSDKKEIFLLDGLLKCSECGSDIKLRARDKSSNKAYTVCSKYRKLYKEKRVCSSHGNDYDKLEQLVISALRNEINLINKETLIIKVQNKLNEKENSEKANNDITKLKNEINKLNQNLEKMYLDKLNNTIDEVFFSKIQRKIKNDILICKNEIIDLKKQDAETEINLNKLTEITSKYLDLKVNNRALFLELINYIEIHENKTIDVHFNFSSGDA